MTSFSYSIKNYLINVDILVLHMYMLFVICKNVKWVVWFKNYFCSLEYKFIYYYLALSTVLYYGFKFCFTFIPELHFKKCFVEIRKSKRCPTYI